MVIVLGLFLLHVQIPVSAVKHVKEFLGLIKKAHFHLIYLMSVYSFLYSAVSYTDLYYELFFTCLLFIDMLGTLAAGNFW